jgi:hypothetical protein
MPALAEQELSLLAEEVRLSCTQGMVLSPELRTSSCRARQDPPSFSTRGGTGSSRANDLRHAPVLLRRSGSPIG